MLKKFNLTIQFSSKICSEVLFVSQVNSKALKQIHMDSSDNSIYSAKLGNI